MCGIIAVLPRPSERPVPAPEWLVERVSVAAASIPDEGHPGLALRLGAASIELEEVDAALRGTSGVRALLETPAVSREINAAVAQVEGRVERLERWADSVECTLVGAELEAFNGAL